MEIGLESIIKPWRSSMTTKGRSSIIQCFITGLVKILSFIFEVKFDLLYFIVLLIHSKGCTSIF